MAARPFAQRLGLAAWRPSVHAPRLGDLHRAPAPEKPNPDEAALRAAVLAAPDDDAPRWDYARRCARRGDPYGDFIAGQLRDAGATCFVRHDSPWLGPLRALSVRDVSFRRGFPESLSLSGRAFVSRGAELFAFAPIRSVRLVAVDPVRGELAGCPHLARLRGLSLAGCRLGSRVAELAEAGAFAGLDWLDVSRNDLTAGEIERLMADRGGEYPDFRAGGVSPPSSWFCSTRSEDSEG